MKPRCQLARKRQTGRLLLRPPLHVLYIFPVGNPAPCTLWGAVRLYLLPVGRSEPRPDLLNPVLSPGIPPAKRQPDNQKLARSSPARCGLGRGTPVVCPCHSDYAMHVSTGMISWKYGLSEASHTKPARLPSGAITNASPDFGAKNVRGAAGSKQTPQIPASDGELMAITPLQRTTP